jgi:hypothetical protein
VITRRGFQTGSCGRGGFVLAGFLQMRLAAAKIVTKRGKEKLFSNKIILFLYSC